jgi:hypothetical protein
MAAYYDFFRKILLQPDGITLEADSVEDTLTITGGNGVSLNPNATTDSFTIDVDYQLYVPIGTTNIRLQDVKSAFTGVSLTPGSNIAITRTSNNELTITATVGASSKSISNITRAFPAVVTTSNNHEFTEGTEVTITDVVGMTQVNGEEYFMDILTGNTFALYTDELLTAPLDSTGFTLYSTGGVATADYSSVKSLASLVDVNSTGALSEDILVYKSGTWTPSKNIVADMVGSVFSDDSSVLVDAVNSKHYGTFIGDLIGEITGTVTSIANHTTTNLSEGANLYYTDVRADARITAASITDLSDADQGVATTDSPNFVTVTANVTGNLTGNLTGNAAGAHTGTLDGDVTGSVFGDDSTILVDGVAGKIVGEVTGNINTTSLIATSIKVGGGNPTVDYDVGGEGTTNVSDSIAYTQFINGSAKTAQSFLDSKSIEPNWAAITGTDYSHTKAQLRFLRGNPTDALKAIVSNPISGYGDTIILGNVDDDGTSVELRSGLGITGSKVNLLARGDDTRILIQNESDDAPGDILINNISPNANSKLELVMGTNASGVTAITLKPTGIEVWGPIEMLNHPITGNLTGNVTGTLDGDVTGSVFGDDSSLLVDGINNRLVMANNTTDDLAEGSNNKYFTNGRAIAMTIVFG